MATVTVYIDPTAQSYTNDQIVAMVNAASAQITRASTVATAALVAGAAKANLDAMSNIERGYIKTNADNEGHEIISMQRNATGKLQVRYNG